jgi:two-component system, sensor histidine kinase and response regulator
VNIRRRCTEQALGLVSNEKRYRQILETSWDAFVGMNSRGKVADWNAMASATFGWPREEVLGKTLS